MRRLDLFWLSIVVVLISLANSACAELPAIELHALSRLGGQAGTAFEMELVGGQRTDEVDRLYFSHEGISASVLKGGPPAFSDVPTTFYGKFRVEIGADVPPGFYEVRAFGRYGLSNARKFLVTRRAWQVTAANDHSKADKSLSIPWQTIIQDTSGSRQRKYYQIELSAGQTVSIQTYATLLDSRARLVLQVFDPDNVKLHEVAPIDEQETELHFTPTRSGKYQIVLFDQLYQGGAEFQFAWIAQPGEEKPDAGLLDEWKAAVGSFDISAGQDIAMAQAMPPARFTLRAPASDLPYVEHREGDWQDKQAMPLIAPCLVNGDFSTNEDQDWFDFSLEKGSEIVMEIVSQRLGELTDPQLVLFKLDNPGTKDEKPRQVAQMDDPPVIGGADFRIASKDPILLFKPPETATYRLLIRDQQRLSKAQRNNRKRYLLEIRKPKPDFALIAHIAFPLRELEQARMISPTLVRAGTQAISVYKIAYDGFSQAIELSVDGLPEGVMCAQGVLAADQNITHLIMGASPTAESAVADLLLRGSSTLDGQSVSRKAHYFELEWGLSEFRRTPRAHSIQNFPMAVNAADMLPISIALVQPPSTAEKISNAFTNWLKLPTATEKKADLVVASRGTTSKIPVVLERREGGKQQVIVRLKNIPAKTTVNEITLPPDKMNGELTWTIAKDAPLGEYLVWAQCETVVKFKPNPQALERVQKRLADLQGLLKTATDPKDTTALEAEIKATNDQIKPITDVTRLQDFPAQLASLPIRLRIIEPPEPKKE